MLFVIQLITLCFSFFWHWRRAGMAFLFFLVQIVFPLVISFFGCFFSLAFCIFVSLVFVLVLSLLSHILSSG
jgi:hypothetical protein